MGVIKREGLNPWVRELRKRSSGPFLVSSREAGTEIQRNKSYGFVQYPSGVEYCFADEIRLRRIIKDLFYFTENDSFLFHNLSI